MRWVPFNVDEEFLRDQIKNKMIRPIPQSLSSLVIEQALARSVALARHKLLATGLGGAARQSLDEAFSGRVGRPLSK
jgi:hypothetical protein